MWIRPGEILVSHLRRDSESKKGGFADWMSIVRAGRNLSPGGTGLWETITRWGRADRNPQTSIEGMYVYPEQADALRMARILAEAKARDSRYHDVLGRSGDRNPLVARISASWTVDEWLRFHSHLVRRQLVRPHPHDPLSMDTEFVMGSDARSSKSAALRVGLADRRIVLVSGDIRLDDTEAMGLACCVAYTFGDDAKAFLGDEMTVSERFRELLPALDPYPSVIALARDVGLLPTMIDYDGIMIPEASPWAPVF